MAFLKDRKLLTQSNYNKKFYFIEKTKHDYFELNN